MTVCKGSSPIHREFDPLQDPEPREAYFDIALEAWVLSKYDDVIAAFRSDALRPVSARPTPSAVTADDELRLTIRAETMAALSSTELEKWRDETAQFADRLLSDLASKQEIDLVGDYARPLCEYLAMVITRPVCTDMQILLQMASQISAAAAEPFDLALAAEGEQCERELKKYFTSGPQLLRDSGFVAVSQGLPCLLSRCWLALLQHPTEWTRLRDNPLLMRTAVEELYRYAGLTQTLFRSALADVIINGIQIREGERLMLRIDAANRDSARFVAPDSLDVSIAREKHLTLGLAKHACVAGPLLRMVLVTSTDILVQRFRSASLIGQIDWRGGSGFRFPTAINVLIQSTEKTSERVCDKP
jgi:cytochrome P450